jgi:hypothetical protein
MISLFRKLWSPSQSIILVYDHLTADNLDLFEEQILEVGNYYRWGKLSELSPPQKNKCQTGIVALVFENARKSVFLKAVPWLEQKKIPFTLGVRTDCIGMNHIPWADEYRLYHPQAPLSSAELKHAWESPEWAESQRQVWRKLGPLPLNHADPTHFFSTWGQILKISPELIEVALYVNRVPPSAEWLTNEKKFIEAQTGRAVTSSLSPFRCDDFHSHFKAAGISTLVALSEVGTIEKTTQKLVLPRFELISAKLDKNSPGDSL